jgi:hypothetical protein
MSDYIVALVGPLRFDYDGPALNTDVFIRAEADIDVIERGA